MKRIILGVAAALALAVAPALATTDTASKVLLPPPKCAISGAKYIASTGRVIGQGRCVYKVRRANGKLRTVVPKGAQWSYNGLKVTDFTPAPCPVTVASGKGNTFVVKPSGAYQAVVAFKLWLKANRYHRAAKVVQRTVTTKLGGKVVCGAPAVTAPEGPNSPTGSGNGGNAQSGFIVGWAGDVVVDSSGVHIPPLDASGNGECKWTPDGGSYNKYGYTFRTGTLRCANGVDAFVIIHLDVTRPDGTSCTVDVAGASVFPLKPGWGGSFSGGVAVSSADNSNIPKKLIQLQKGTSNGPPLC